MIGRKDSTTEKLYRILANFSRSVKNMIGATHSSDGAAGLVPQPRAGDEDKALLGNGTWGKVDSIYKYKTEEEYNQAVANNEIPDGATVIKEWDEELSVIPVDSELSEESLNPLQNKVITQKIAELNQSIEELNVLLGGKLDVSKIANNLVTTEEGYVLDARQGKALSDEMNKHRIIWNDNNLTLYCDERIGVMHLVGFGVYTLPQWGWFANFGQLTDTHKPPTDITCNGHVIVHTNGVISTSQELSNSMEVINVSWRIRQ